MSTYSRYGTATSLFEAGKDWAFKGHMLYHTATEFGLRYGDGSTAYFSGSGLVWNETAGAFTAGTITAINHYSNGKFNDSLENLSLPAAACQSLFEAAASADWLRAALFGGDDVLDARHRLNDAVIDEKLIGYDGDDRIYGGAGNDLLGGEGGDDAISGGGGNDRMFGGSGHDVLYGGDGGDRINAGSGDDSLKGGTGDDILYGADGNDSYIGGEGTDTAVYARSLYDLVMTPTASGFTVIEPHGVDSLSGIERLACDEGIFIWNSNTATWVKTSSTPGELLLNPGSCADGTVASDTIDLAGLNQNMARGFGGRDTLTGTSGFDVLFGGNGGDKLVGDNSNTIGNLDRLHGDNGNDRLYGQAGDDILYGGAGNDIVAGGTGNDELTGGQGADVFVFKWSANTAETQVWGHDLIRDFEIGVDHIALQFIGLPAGTGTVPDFYQTSAGAIITLAGAGSILLKDVDAAGYTIWDLLA